MKKFLLIQVFAVFFFSYSANAQYDEGRQTFGIQFGLGAFSFNTSQYNAVAAYSKTHVKSWNTYPQFLVGLSVFPVTSKYNIDIGAGGWETSHRLDKHFFPRIYSTNGFRLKQSFGYGDINFSYRVLGTPNTLVIPSIGVGYMGNYIHYQYKSIADANADEDDEYYDDGSGDNNTNIKVAKNYIYYLNFKLNYFIHANKSLWYGVQLGYKYSFTEKHTLYNSNFPAGTNHLLNGFYASLIIAL